MAGDNPVQEQAFYQIITVELEEFIKASREFGEPVSTVANFVKEAFECEFSFISTGIRHDYSGSRDRVMELRRPIDIIFQKIQAFCDQNRHSSEYGNHLATVAGSIMALNWISVEKTPVQFIRDMKDSGDYYGNRVLSANRGNPQHASWINKWNAVLKALEQYVRDYFLTGFVWGCCHSGTVDPIKSGPTAPPPPPPMCATTFKSSGSDEQRHALLNQLNQGMGIVQMLRPVKPVSSFGDGQRGPTDLHGGTNRQGVPRMYPRSQGEAPPRRVCAPIFELQDKKWIVEHYTNKYDLMVHPQMNEGIGVFHCDHIGLEVDSKLRGVTIESCKSSTIVLKDVITSIELIRCDHVKVICNGRAPSISLDNCDSVQVFLTEESMDAEIVSSKSTSLNVCLLAKDGDYVELPVPEQIRSTVMNGKLVSSPVEKA